MKAILKINDKEIEVEVSEEQIKKLTEKKKSPFARVEEDEEYYLIDYEGKVSIEADWRTIVDEKIFSVANYCTDKDLIQQQAWRETLNRLLWRWQYENDEPCDWDILDECKYNIFMDTTNNELFYAFVNRTKQLNTVYFSTADKAEQAIEEVVKPFMAEHPDFVW